VDATTFRTSASLAASARDFAAPSARFAASARDARGACGWPGLGGSSMAAGFADPRRPRARRRGSSSDVDLLLDVLQHAELLDHLAQAPGRAGNSSTRSCARVRVDWAPSAVA
jgi:hypothetical protein